MCNCKNCKDEPSKFSKSGFYVFKGRIRKIRKEYNVPEPVKYEPSTWLQSELKKMRD